MALVGAGLFGCSGTAETLKWQPATGRALHMGLDEAIWECETSTVSDRDDILEGRLVNARPYGGWGDFAFDLCMAQNGWKLSLPESSDLQGSVK